MPGRARPGRGDTAAGAQGLLAAENGAFDSHGIRPGQIWRARFDEPGMFPYYCGPHPFMKGVVVVEPR